MLDIKPLDKLMEWYKIMSDGTQQSEDKERFNDMFDAGLKLPPGQRAMIAQYYYQRVHLRVLGLRLAATIDYHILKQVFGEGAETIVEQALVPEDFSDEVGAKMKISLA